jgi:hypothetical protein
MSRWLLCFFCAIVGLLLFACGLQIPAHLRATDARVIQKAGANSPGLLSKGLALVREQKLGAAQFLAQSARALDIPEHQQLEAAVANLARTNPPLQFWGSPEPRLETLFGPTFAADAPATTNLSLTEFLVREENRARALELLRVSTNLLAQELLHYRSATNTVIFSPAQSASGQALDTSISLCGLLVEEGHLNTNFYQALFQAAFDSNRKPNSPALEQALLDLMSLGQRLNWGQLTEFISRVQDGETLRLLANLVRKAGPSPLPATLQPSNAPTLARSDSPTLQRSDALPILFSAVELSGNPAGVARYLVDFSQSGQNDLRESLPYGAGGINELLHRNQRLYHSRFVADIGADSALQTPQFALTVKWLLYLLAGFLLAVSLHFGRPSVSALERPLQVRGFHVAREILFALGFLLVVLIVSEPFLAQESQKVDMPFRLRLPMVGSAVPAKSPGANVSIMNLDKKSLLTLLLFFTLQALLYISCLVKLAEIRRQGVAPRIKLRLLENEEHLFDAGLYLGFAGTIVSLILVSVGVIQQSLMAAYSSTSFGIIFVSIFKIFHLRPARRKLLLQAETAPAEPMRPAVAARPVPAPL